MITEKAYLINWYGPFIAQDVKKTREMIGEWESENPKEECNLYLIWGKKPNKKKPSYYCGKTIQGVHERFGNKGHHINDVNRINGIWIGCFCNIKPTESDILVAENLYTALLADKVGRQEMLNKINMDFPTKPVTIISRWINKDSMKPYHSRDEEAPINKIDDVCLYNYDSEKHRLSLWGATKLRKMWDVLDSNYEC